MEEQVCIIGNYLSPYVRKVLVFLAEKGVPYQIDPSVPFFGEERFSKLNSLRRIPILSDDQVTLSDSAGICRYLEERHPEPALYPSDPPDYARALAIEEYADNRLGEVLIGRLFNQVVVRPAVWGEKTDPAAVERTLKQEIPPLLDHLETQLPAAGFLFPRFGIADIALGCFFRSAAFAGYKVDASRWPLTAAFIERVLARDSFGKLAPIEECLLTTPVARHRSVLAALGAPLTRASHGIPAPKTSKPRP